MQHFAYLETVYNGTKMSTRLFLKETKDRWFWHAVCCESYALINTGGGVTLHQDVSKVVDLRRLG